MRVGVVILPEYPWQEARRIWAEVESAGFDHAWTYDHLAWRSLRSSRWYSSVPTLTAAALTTRDITLGTLVTSPNFRHPVPLAKDVMALDDISQGRLIVGVGAGAAGLDEHLIGRTPLGPSERAERFREFVEVLDALLRTEVTEYRGRHYTVNDCPMVPGCVQRPRVPFAIAATARRGIRTAARHAQIWVTNGDPKRFGELPERESLRLVAHQREMLLRECERIGRPVSDIKTMVNGSVVGDDPTASAQAFVDFAGACARLGFTDITVHHPRDDGIFAGDRSAFIRTMTRALPVVRDM